MDNKIVTARFATDDNYVNVYDVYQWSYGQVLRIEGLKLPNMVEIHFSLQETSGEAKTRIGVTKDGVTDVVIPDSFLENEGIGDKYKIFVWVYVADKNSGSTEYKITIHVKARAKPEITHGGQDGEVFQEAVEAVRDAAARAAESEKQAERWAVGRVDIPGSETDNSKFYSEESKKNAQQTTKDKEAVEELVKETENIGQLAEDVKANAQKASESAKNAETSATNASASEKNAKTSESNASTSETNAKASEANAKASEQAVEKSKQTVDKTVADFGQAVTDASAALKSEKDAHVKAITTAGTTETKKVTDEGAKQVQTVQSMGTQETEKVTAEGTKQVGLVKTEGEKHLASVQTAAQEIIADREQINTNKEGVAQLKEDLSELSEEVGQLKQNGTGTGTGLSTEAIDKLEEVGNYLVYTTADGGSKWTELIAILRSGSSGSGSGEIVPATGISLDKTTLSFTTATTQTLIATVDPSNSTDKVTWESSNTGIATVSGGVVTPASNGSCTITAKSGSYSASCEVTVAVESEIVTYTITNNLTNTSTDNPVTTITKNSPYEANLTPDTNHEFDSVIVTMGGVDVTSDVYTNGTIVISVVTGNVVITAIASEPQSEEVVMLKSITGDGASYIDTEFIVENNTNVFELSGTLASSTSVTLFGADGYNVETPYGNTLLKNTNQGYMHGALNYGQFSNLGTWNNSGANSLVGNRWWVVLKDGEQKIYLDAEHTKQQANATNTTATYGTGKEYVPIPLYLFTSNATSSANAKYTPCDCTIYFFKISKASGEVIHEYLPARQGTKIGMYDTVTQKFHENIGTGTFSYEEVEA